MSKLKTQNHNSNLKTNLRYRAYNFSLDVVKLVSQLSNNRLYLAIADQLLRASTSIGANLIEAKAASSKRDFIKFYEIALKSANEAKYWLCLLRDSELMKRERVEPLIKEVSEISNMIGSSLLTMKGKR